MRQPAKRPREADAGRQERAPAKLSALLTQAMLLLAIYQRGRDPFSMMHLPTDEHRPKTCPEAPRGDLRKDNDDGRPF